MKKISKSKIFNLKNVALQSVLLLLVVFASAFGFHFLSTNQNVNNTVFASGMADITDATTQVAIDYVVYEVLDSTSNPKTAQVVGYLDSMPPNSSITLESSVTINGVSGYSVTSIGYDAFRDCTSLSEIIIPSSVTSIGNGAFNGCSGLRSVVFPSNSLDVGVNAFKDCYGLTSVDVRIYATHLDGGCIFFSESGSSAMQYARLEFTNDTTVRINTTFGCMGGSVLKTIYMSSSGVGEVVSLGFNFAGCTALKSITIPAAYRDGGEEMESMGFDFVTEEVMEGLYPTDLREIYMASSTALTGLQDTWDEYTVSSTGVLTKVQSAVSAANVLGGANGATKHYVRSDVPASDIFVLEMRSDKVLDQRSDFYTLSADGKTAYKVCVKGSVFGELPTSNGQELNWQYSASDVVWHSDVSSSIAANDGAKYVLSVAASSEETGVMANIVLPSVMVVTITGIIGYMAFDTVKKRKRI